LSGFDGAPIGSGRGLLLSGNIPRAVSLKEDLTKASAPWPCVVNGTGECKVTVGALVASLADSGAPLAGETGRH
jgi:hypothetical protein